MCYRLTASLFKGKLSRCEEIVVTNDTIIPALNSYDSYKYLAMFKNDKLEESLV